MHNLEPSGFRKNEYIGCSEGRVYRISRRRSGSGWVARHFVDGHDVGNPYVFARTLTAMSDKLAAMADQAQPGRREMGS